MLLEFQFATWSESKTLTLQFMDSPSHYKVNVLIKTLLGDRDLLPPPPSIPFYVANARYLALTMPLPQCIVMR